MIYGLTKRQREALDFIAKYQTEHGGVSPNYDEISAALGIRSKSNITRIIYGLEERGAINPPKRKRRLPRDIVIKGAKLCPHCGGFLP